MPTTILKGDYNKTQVLSCEDSKTFKSNYFKEHLKKRTSANGCFLPFRGKIYIYNKLLYALESAHISTMVLPKCFSFVLCLMSLLNCVPCVLKTCSRANVPCVVTCPACLRAHVLTSLAYLRAHVPACLVCLRTHLPTSLACLRSHLKACLTCLRAHVPKCFACLRAHVKTCHPQ